MAYEFHADKPKYFKWQYLTSRDYIIPFVNDNVKIDANTKVLEIGSAEAGVLKAFTELNCKSVGIELMDHRVERAKTFMTEELSKGLVQFITRDIYDIDVDKDLPFKFDLIILKDVIEHIHDQAKFMSRVADFLNPDGKLFFGFPPWYMPFGGHQQVCQSKFLSKLPYFHLFPMPIYKWILKIFGESAKKIEALEEIKETGISIERFERILKQNNFKSIKRKFFLFNPIYKFKFGLNARKQLPIIDAIPFFRNFYTTAAYYLIEKK